MNIIQWRLLSSQELQSNLQLELTLLLHAPSGSGRPFMAGAYTNQLSVTRLTAALKCCLLYLQYGPTVMYVTMLIFLNSKKDKRSVEAVRRRSRLCAKNVKCSSVTGIPHHI